MTSGASHLRMLPSPRAWRTIPFGLRRPHPVEQMLNEVLEDGGIQLIHDLLAVALGEDEPRVTESAEVPGDGGPGGRELLGDLAGGLGSVAEQAENLASRRVGERAEGIHASDSIRYLDHCASIE